MIPRPSEYKPIFLGLLSNNSTFIIFSPNILSVLNHHNPTPKPSQLNPSPRSHDMLGANTY